MVAVTLNTVRRQVFTQIKGEEEEEVAWAELGMWAHFPSWYLHFGFSLTNFIIKSLVVGCALQSTNVLSLYLFDGGISISSHLRMPSSCWTLSSCPLPSSQLSFQACLYPEPNQLYPVLTRNSTSHTIHKLIPWDCLLIISFLVPFISGWSFGHLPLGCCSSHSPGIQLVCSCWFSLDFVNWMPQVIVSKLSSMLCMPHPKPPPPPPFK